MELFGLLAGLTGIDGVSGHEQEVVRNLVDRFRKAGADRVEIDHMGNIYSWKEGASTGPTVMIAAHSDEVGMLVRSIEKNGFIRLEKLWGINPAILPGRMVRIKSHFGVIGVRPGHLPFKGQPDLHSLYVDVGATSDDEVRSMGIEVGDPVAFVGELRRIGPGKRVAGKALDNRLACALEILLLERIKELDFAGRVCLAVTVQEEPGMRGAQVAAYRVKPDYAILVDTIPSGDTPDVDFMGELPVTIGGGPVFPLVSGGYIRGNLMHPGMKRLLYERAREKGIPFQPVTLGVEGAVTDVASLHLVREGIPAGVVALPRRYSHSPVELADLGDAEKALELLEAIVAANGTAGQYFDFI